MYKNIIAFAGELPDFLNNYQVLKDRKKRKKIGRDIIALERIIYSLKENAILVQNELEKAIKKTGAGEKYYVTYLNSVLQEQAELIEKVFDIRYGRYSYNTLFRVYEYDHRVFEKLVDGKLNLVHLIYCSLRFSQNALPKTFDLSDYFTKTNKGVFGYYSIRYWETYDKFEDGEMSFVTDNREELLNHLLFLQDQVKKFDSVNKLDEAHKKMVEIIKANFTIEEILSLSEENEK